ncbi:response regulator [Methylobacterium sp. SyP6R]|uniref:response regulator n=1 Tax=Methylobacterium sp. SyP6R TaxID=2718876 RepID=UPI001F009BF6|nr:response regulator [Methylobacterium sp. SyP6R]MCF4124453.1 response regulator [Methylobacterium sp. SyP6R]
MRSANFFFQGREDAAAKPVISGVARGLLETLSLPNEYALPDRLQELANLLIERDALGNAKSREVNVAPTKLVLVVEDDPAIRDLAIALLEETVLDVIACESGDEAVEMLKAQGGNIAMVFTDVRLEGWMDGVDLARAVRSLWPGVHLVVTSGQGGGRVGDMPTDVVFLPKPWRALDVLVQVDHAVRRLELPVGQTSQAKLSNSSAMFMKNID